MLYRKSTQYDKIQLVCTGSELCRTFYPVLSLFQAREVCIRIRMEEEAGSGGWPQCLSAPARTLCIEGAFWPGQALTAGPGTCCPTAVSASTDGGVQRVYGVFCVVAAAPVCSTIEGAFSGPGSAGNEPCGGHRGGFGVGFCWSGAAPEARSGRTRPGRAPPFAHARLPPPV